MASSNSGWSWEDLKKWMGSDEVEGVEGLTGRVRGHRPRMEGREKMMELLNEIRAICNTDPWNLTGIIHNEDIKVTDLDNGKILVSADFMQKATGRSKGPYRKSKWYSYYSFIPVLMDQGWLWHDAVPNKKGREFPTYQYFIGTHEIEAAINRFNRKYAKKGLKATFEVDDYRLI